MFRSIAGCAALFAALTLAPVAGAQAVPPAPQETPAPRASEPLTRRIAGLVPILRGEADYDAYFAPGFRAQVPRERFAQMTAQIIASNGPVTEIESMTPLSPWSADFTIGFRDGIATARMAVEPDAPHLVSGLRLTGITAREATIDAIVASVRALPGRTGLAIARLGESAPELLTRHNADQPFAVGSAFKLVILAEIVRSVNAGERQWTDMVTIDGNPLPGGNFTFLPAGTQVSIRDLAAKMISISDNSATDILIRFLGRERIEAMLPVVGIANPSGMRPFMGALEMFKIKGVRGGALATEWIASDEAGRRAMLAGPIAAEPVGAIDQGMFARGVPIHIDRIEWFASPADLVRVMDWLRRNAVGPGAEAMAVLGINPSLPATASGRWEYVGFKGGSEPGVVNLTYLLRAPGGGWYAISGSWNDTAAEVDNTRFAGLLGRAAELAAP